MKSSYTKIHTAPKKYSHRHANYGQFQPLFISQLMPRKAWRLAPLNRASLVVELLGNELHSPTQMQKTETADDKLKLLPSQTIDHVQYFERHSVTEYACIGFVCD